MSQLAQDLAHSASARSGKVTLVKVSPSLSLSHPGLQKIFCCLQTKFRLPSPAYKSAQRHFSQKYIKLQLMILELSLNGFMLVLKLFNPGLATRQRRFTNIIFFLFFFLSFILGQLFHCKFFWAILVRVVNISLFALCFIVTICFFL